MVILALLTLGALATYRIVYDYTREFVQDDGSIKRLEGPFRIYARLQSFVPRASFLPLWVRENHDCFYCMSFWTGSMFAPFQALLLTLETGTPQGVSVAVLRFICYLTLFAVANSAPTLWWASRNRLMFEAKPGSY